MKKRKQNQQAFDDGPSDKALGVQDTNDSDEEDDDSQEIVNVDFEFFDPKEEDFHGVKALLRTYLDDATWDLSGFVDIILGQPTVGTVIKTAEDESPIGVITVLNLGRYKEKSCLLHVYDFLKRNVSDGTKVEAVFNNNPGEVGLLVSERLINIPEELASPLYKGLLDEVSWAIEDEPTKILRDSFKFKQYLIVSRIFQQLPKKKKKGAPKKLKKQSKQQSVSGNEEMDNGELIYIKPEDELFHKLSHWSCKFPASSEAAAAHEIQGLKQFRLVMLLSAQSMELFKSQFCIVE
ncbi:hypothetical protein GOP47_0002788 [Adiantum capillus-veneris]|uniref:Protein BCCIP homolog n=1 Tax=Adiantum capillus-veneris TaxID=13818 RepID=A0A9D4VBK9_ADICA|nr:hypothetical protein GOP47_0002788 [Adiantum capillus-veneris]